MSIPGIDKLGMFMLIDGSIFPVIKTMTWATYKSTSNPSLPIMIVHSPTDKLM